MWMWIFFLVSCGMGGRFVVVVVWVVVFGGWLSGGFCGDCW